jgi:hypothetical protein
VGPRYSKKLLQNLIIHLSQPLNALDKKSTLGFDMDFDQIGNMKKLIKTWQLVTVEGRRVFIDECSEATLESGFNTAFEVRESKANARTTTEIERQKKSVNGSASNAFRNPVWIPWKNMDERP